MPAEEFSVFMFRLSQYLGYTPEPDGIEEECIKQKYYLRNVAPIKAAFDHKMSLQGPPAKERRLHF